MELGSDFQIIKTLRSMWEEILLVKVDGEGADFFALGGHSLLAIELVSQIEDVFQIEINMKDILENETLDKLSLFIIQQKSNGNLKKNILTERNNSILFPLTPNQSHIWGLVSLFPLDVTHNISNAIRINKKLDLTMITNVLNKIFVENDALRISFIKQDNKVFQKVNPHKNLDLSFIPISEAELMQTLNKEMSYRFDLEKENLIRIKFYRISDNEFVFFFMAHHIVWDGISNIIFFNTFLEEYEALEQGFVPKEIKRSSSYQDYVLDQFQNLQKPDYIKKINFWKKRFSGVDPISSVERSYEGSIHEHDCNVLNVKISEDLLKKSQTYVRSRNLSLYNLFFACFNFLLFQRTSSLTQIIGTPVHGRSDRKYIKTLGYFINTLPFLHKLNKELSLKDNISLITSDIADCLSHQDIPFEYILRKTDATHLLSKGALFQTLFVYLDITKEMKTFERDEFDLVKIDRKSTHCEIDFYLYKAEREIDVVIEYRKNLFSKDMIKGFFEDYIRIISICIDSEETLLKDFQLIVDDKDKIKRYLDLKSDDHHHIPCIPNFLEVIFKNIDMFQKKEAVRFGNITLTYSDLGERINRISSLLIQRGIVAGDVVGVYLERDENLIPGLLALLNLGATYLPLDPSFPQDRLKYMTKKSECKLILTSQKIDSGFLGLSQCFVEDMSNDADLKIQKYLNPDTSAYLLFTSGSTGNPKGVEVTQANISNFLAAMSFRPGMTEDDKLLSVTTISFDISVLEMFLPLYVGGSLYLASRDEAINPSALKNIIQTESITLMQATPVTWRMLLNQDQEAYPGLKVLCGGEALDATLAHDLLQRTKELWNMYGPTETTVWSSVKKIELGDSPISIGRPILNTSFHILDDDLSPMPIGEKGNLYIGGKGVSLGYFKDPELTNLKFIKDPRSGELIYDTGDIAYYNEDGNLVCLGRADHQVKVRGYRIELAEIEEALIEVEGIFEAATKVIKDEIYAFVSLKSGYNDHDQIKNSIIKDLRNKLPPYMIVKNTIILPNLIKTPNGKIDRNKLDIINLEKSEEIEILDVNPEVKTVINHIWKKHLAIDDIDENESFFNLGGHSLIALDIFNHINSHFNINLDLSLIFKHHSILKLAKLTEEELNSKNDGIKDLIHIVKINENINNQYNIFCFHGVGGNVINYYPLASVLKKYNFYGVQSSGLNGRDEVISSISEMARIYILEIKKIQAQGPYLLAGGSMGGVIAMEVAKQLVKAGEDVNNVYMFDTFGPDLKIGRDNLTYENLANRAFHKILKFIDQKIFLLKVYFYKIKKMTLPHKYRYKFIEHRNISAMRSFNLDPYLAPVTLIRVRQTAGGVYSDPSLGWKSIIKGEFEIIEIDGQHNSFIETKDFLEALSNILNK